MDGERIGKLAADSLKDPLVLVEEFKRLLAPIPEDDYAISEWWKRFVGGDTNEDSASTEGLFFRLSTDYSPEYAEWRNRYDTVKNAIRTILQFGNDELPWTHVKEWAHDRFWECGWHYGAIDKARTLRFVAAEFHAAVILRALADAAEETATTVRWSNYRSPQEWRQLIKKAGGSHSATTWTRLRNAFPKDFEGEAKYCRLTRAMAERLNLNLPEFKD